APLLLVDDDPACRGAMVRLLNRAGFSVETAADGAELLQMLGQFTPRLVILDLMLPGIGGMEALRQIRADPSLMHLRVVVLSGDVQMDRDELFGTLGVAEVLAKPVQFTELLAVITRHAPASTGPA